MIDTVAGEAAKFTRIDDSMTAAIINLSRRSWRIKPGTGSPVKGEWMSAPNNLRSVHDIMDVNGANSAEAIKEVLSTFEGKGMGMAPWSSCTLGHAGGGWGPASVICYEDPTDNLTVTLMMLIRPGFDYCAGVNISRGWIGNRADGDGWEIYTHIENREQLFSTGVKKAVEFSGVRVTFQPARSMQFLIKDV